MPVQAMHFWRQNMKGCASSGWYLKIWEDKHNIQILISVMKKKGEWLSDAGRKLCKVLKKTNIATPTYKYMFWNFLSSLAFQGYIRLIGCIWRIMYVSKQNPQPVTSWTQGTASVTAYLDFWQQVQTRTTLRYIHIMQHEIQISQVDQN